MYRRLNTCSFILQAAVRSSRRKRNQYVVDLRQNVDELKRRKKEASEQNNLLRTLTVLWERLCSEVCFFILFSYMQISDKRVKVYELLTHCQFMITGRRRIKRGY